MGSKAVLEEKSCEPKKPQASMDDSPTLQPELARSDEKYMMPLFGIASILLTQPCGLGLAEVLED
jgi:hypothetical protein